MVAERDDLHIFPAHHLGQTLQPAGRISGKGGVSQIGPIELLHLAESIPHARIISVAIQEILVGGVRDRRNLRDCFTQRVMERLPGDVRLLLDDLQFMQAVA